MTTDGAERNTARAHQPRTRAAMRSLIGREPAEFALPTHERRLVESLIAGPPTAAEALLDEPSRVRFGATSWPILNWLGVARLAIISIAGATGVNRTPDLPSPMASESRLGLKRR